jgi:hypothetical protein
LESSNSSKDTSPESWLSRNYNKIAYVTALLLLLSATLAYYATVWHNSDLWGHLKFGLCSLASGQIPIRHDLWSYTAYGADWIHHEWLAEILFVICYKAAGPFGLALLHIVLIETLGCILFFIYKRTNQGVIPTVTVPSLALIGLGAGIKTLRPQLFTFIFLLIECNVLANYKSCYRLLLLPPMFMLWVNCHGGALAGFMVLAVWTIIELSGQLIQQQFNRREALIWLVILLAGFLAILINPYGIKLVQLGHEYCSLSRQESIEWRSVLCTDIYYGSGAYILYSALIIVALIHWSKTHSLRTLSYTEKRNYYCRMTMLGIMGLSPFIAVRHLHLFIITAFSMFSKELAAFVHSRFRRDIALFDRLSKGRSSIKIAAVSIALISSLWMSVLGFKNLGKFYSAEVDCPYPRQAIKLLKASNARGNLLAFMDWGQYCMWWLFPDWKVAFDGRQETVYSQAVSQSYWHFIFGMKGWNNLLTKYPTDAVLIPPGTPAYKLMTLEDDWEEVFSDSSSALFVHKNSQLADCLLKVKSQLPLLPVPAGEPQFP